MRLPFAVIAGLLAVLIPLGFADDESDEPELPQMASVATIAGRVEALRELEFDQTPVPVSVTPEEAVREGLEDLDRGYPEKRRRADEALYIQLGLLPEGTDLREQAASIFGEQVAGYYDPRTQQLRLVEGVAGTRVTNEMIIAHELDHALEDQALGLDLESIDSSDDPAYAYQALAEGTASAVMYAYVTEHFTAEEGLGGLLADGLTAPSTLDLPPFLVAQLLFPYVNGERFAQALYREAGGWKLLDQALRERPPVSTEQVLHPDKWLEDEKPIEVDLPAPRPGFERLTEGVFGEWQTGQLLQLSGQVQTEATEGWGGDRYALDRGSDRDVLTIQWVHDSFRDGREFVEALNAYVDNGVPEGVRAVVSAGENGVTLRLFARRYG